MDEMTCVRSLLHTFFDDNSGWHVTAVDLLSANNLKVAHHVHQFTTGPPQVDCKLRAWGARLSMQCVR